MHEVPGTGQRQFPGTGLRQFAGTDQRQLPGTHQRQLHGTGHRQLPGTGQRQLPGTGARQLPEPCSVSSPEPSHGSTSPYLITFDLDGTLVDSLRDLSDSANEMLARYGAPPLDEDTVGSMVGEGAATLVTRVLAARAVHVPADEALAMFLAIYDDGLVRHTRPYDGIPEALQQLGASAVLAVLTNKPEAASERLLLELDLRRYFRWVIGGDTPLGRKPHPRAFQALMQSAGVAPDATVLVGDSAVDVQTARNAGARLCVARYGFGFRNCPPELLRGDDLMVDQPKDLPPVLGFRVN